MPHAHHEPIRRRPSQVQEEFTDPASQSLAEALRISFILLKFVMLILVVFFVFSGVFLVHPGEVALILRFGKIRGIGKEQVREPGIHFAFPYPVDEVVRMPGPEKVQTVRSESFWFKLTEEDRKKYVQESVESMIGSDLGGYNVTGDVNLLHTRWTVRYTITDPVAFFRAFGRPGERTPEAEATKAPDRAGMLVAFLLENAVIREIGTMGVYEALRDRTADLSKNVHLKLRQELDALGSGIALISVTLDDVVPPRQVKDAFEKVSKAYQERRSKIDAAKAEKNNLLTKTAGAIGVELADKWQELDLAEAEGKDPQRIESLRAEMEALYAKAGGEVAAIKADAEAYKIKFQEAVKADAKRVADIQKGLPNVPGMLELWIEKERVDVVRALLEEAEGKYILGQSGDGKANDLFIMLNPDPQDYKDKLTLPKTR